MEDNAGSDEGREGGEAEHGHDLRRRNIVNSTAIEVAPQKQGNGASTLRLLVELKYSLRHITPTMKKGEVQQIRVKSTAVTF